MTSSRLTCNSLLLGAVFLLLLAPAVSAQLDFTIWLEFTEVNRDSQHDGDSGDLFNPVNTSSSLQGLSATVVYPSAPSPPSVTSTVSGSASGDVVNAWAYALVTFQFKLKEIMAPVEMVDSVSITVTAMGTATAAGTEEFSATARSSLELFGEIAGFMFRLEADVSSLVGTSSFDETVPFAIDPNEVVTGFLLASAQISTGDLGTTDNASAEAFVDPIFVVSSDIIPGTSTRYDEVYELEFSPGYWSLGDPTPVKPSTWGMIKRLYGN